MKTKFLIFIFLAAVSFTYGQEKVIKGKSQVKKIFIQKEEPIKEFPNLEIREKAFIDINNNNIIDGNEKSFINFNVYNSGKGLAENVEVKVSLEDPNTKGITFDKLITIGNLATNESKDISIPVEADKSVQTGKATFIIEVVEKNGFDVPFAMAIETQEFTLPVTIVEGVKEETTQEVITADPSVTTRGVGDPLKGLNVSGERADMQIGNYYALIIGIDDYFGTFDPLNNAVADAESIERLLKSKYKFDNFITLYNRQATRIDILNAFEELSNTVTETDNVFIYYSGHGEFNERQNKGYWVPVDARSNSMAELISNNDIQTALTGIPSKHTLLISDACFAGDIFRGNAIAIPFEESDRYYREIHQLKSRKAITSGDIEPVMDGGRDGHSVFTYYLLRALDSNESRFYDASQLYDRIKIPVTNNSEQRPKFAPIKYSGDEGGQFIFIKK
jgi:hypothetical protein